MRLQADRKQVKYTYSLVELDKHRRRGSIPSYPIYNGFVFIEQLEMKLIKGYLFRYQHSAYIIASKGLWIFDGDTNRQCPSNGEPNIIGIDNGLKYIKTFLDSITYHDIEKVLFQII